MIRSASLTLLLALLGSSSLQAAGIYESVPAAPIPGSPVEAGSPEPEPVATRVAILATPGNERWVVAALEPSENGTASCLWYPGGQIAYVVHSGLPVQRGTSLWLTARLGVQAGAVRIAYWPPGGTEDLEHYAHSPAPRETGGRNADAWVILEGLKTEVSGKRQPLPWDPGDAWRADPPRGFESSPWPLAQAWLASDLRPRLKDCALSGLATGTVVLGAGGTRGAWEASLGRKLGLHFELPPGQPVRRAIVLVEAQADEGFGIAETGLQVSANDWPAEELKLEPLGFQMVWPQWQQVSFDLSHKLQGGLNYLELGAAGISPGACRIASLQVWVQ